MILRTAILLLVLSAATAVAQGRAAAVGNPTQQVPGLERIGVDERLGQQLPLDVRFRNHEGETVTLGQLFQNNKPVLLTFAYHTCDSLCSLVLDATERAVKAETSVPGVDYEVITISIDPRETVERSAAVRRERLAHIGRENADWNFLVGDEAAIRTVTAAAGFRFFYDETQGQYAHAAVAIFVTPTGKFARYLYGLRFDPLDVRIALSEAKAEQTRSTAEKLLLFCYAYDPTKQGYGLVAKNVMKIGGIVSALALFSFLFILWRRERRRGGLFDESNSNKGLPDASKRSGSDGSLEPQQVEA